MGHKSRLVALIFGAVLSSTGARAQVAVYAMGSAGRLSGTGVGAGTASTVNGSLVAYGGTFGVYDGGVRLGVLHLGADGRVFVQNSGNSNTYGNKLLGVIAGPRLSLNLPPLPFRPYVQAEIGLGETNYGVSPSRSDHFAYQIQGGLDFAIIPHLDLRGEYGAGQIENTFGSASHQTLQEIGFGLVLRLF